MTADIENKLNINKNDLSTRILVLILTDFGVNMTIFTQNHNKLITFLAWLLKIC